MTVQDLHSIFGRNIKSFRNMKHWSQEELAERMDVSINTISDIENGKKFVHTERLVQFADIFNTEPYIFLMPEIVFPSDAASIIARFAEEVKESVMDIAGEYTGKTTPPKKNPRTARVPRTGG